MYVLPESAITPRGRLTKHTTKRMLSLLETGEVEAGVFSLNVGVTGVNAQVFNTLIFMSPCTSQYLEEQGKGDILTLLYRYGMSMDCNLDQRIKDLRLASQKRIARGG